MRRVAQIAWLIVVVGPVTAGCSQNPYLRGQQGAALQQQQQQQLAEVNDLQRRASELDTNNRDLHSDLARAQQQVGLKEKELSLVRQRLADTADQLMQASLASQKSDERVGVLEASTRRRGGATISANSSLRRSLPAIDVEGVETRHDGDVVRIELPADKLFLPHTITLHQGAFRLIDQVAHAIAANYPRQVIGIEGHTDSDPIQNSQWRNNHRLSVGQATVVFDQLINRSRVSPSRLFVLGYGANHPLVSNATPAGKARNRRIELVIYPETPAEQ